MSKTKQRIMEVIFKAENGLSNEDISWAVKNIPEDDAPGVVPGDLVVYNHDHSNIFDACGISDEVADRIQQEYKDLRLENSTKSCKSMLIQSIMNKGSNDLIRSLVIRGVASVELKSMSGFSEHEAITLPRKKAMELFDDLLKQLKDAKEDEEKTKKKDSDFEEKLKNLLKKLKGGSDE